MARLPTSAELSGPVLRNAPQPVVADQTGAARGLANFGQALAGIGADFQRQQGTADIAGAEGDFANSILASEREIQNSGDYANYQANFDAASKRALETAAQRIGDKTFRENWINSKQEEIARRRQALADKASGAMREKARVDLASAIEKDQNLYVDPTTPQDDKNAAFQRLNDSILAAEKTGLLDPSQAYQWRKTYRDGAIVTEAQLRILNDPGFRKEVLGGSVVDRIIGVESGGNATAKNPRSSATGLGQFIASTWMNTVRKHRPDLLEGKSTAEVLDLRNDPAISREMVGYLTEDNSQFLQNQGVEASSGNVYLAHFLGPRGAVELVKADPGASAESIVGADVVNANPFLKGKTAADVIAWAEKKMGDASPLRTGVYSEMSPDDRQKLFEVAQKAQAQDDAQQAALFKQKQVEEKDTFSLRIANNDPTLTRNDILNNPIIDNGDKAVLVDKYDTSMKEGMAIGQALPMFEQGRLGEVVNPYSEQGKKLVNGIANTLSQTVAPDKQQGMMEELTRQAGYVPQPYFDGIRRGIQSGDPMAVAGAASAASRINQINPNILGRSENGAAIQSAATKFDYYTGIGMTPEQAGQRIIDSTDPARAKEREAVLASKTVKDFVKNIDASSVSDLFDTALTFAPDLGGTATKEQLSIGYTPQGEAVIMSEYKQMLEDGIMDAGGDLELGKKLADERFVKIYGTSDLALSGSKAVVKYPPEKVYPPASNGSWDYIRAQAMEALKGEGINAENVYLQPYAQTVKDVSQGKPPNYQVFYEQDGQLHLLPSPFYADPSKADEAYLKTYSDEQKAKTQGALTEQDMTDQIRAAREEARKAYADYPETFRAVKMREAEQNVRDQQMETAPAPLPSIDTNEVPATDAMGNPL